MPGSLCLIVGRVAGVRPAADPRPDPPELSTWPFPVARVAATAAVATAALPYLSRWLQRAVETAIGLLALAAVVNGSGLPVAMLAAWRWGGG